MKVDEILARYAPYDTKRVDAELALAIADNHSKIVVLDDDPTGVQTVHDIYVYTNWSRDSIRQGISDGRKAFFILTNSRAFSHETTLKVHQEIAENILKETDNFYLISRSDSTLRGHYPAETRIMYKTLTERGLKIDGEIIYPFFLEGGRLTIDNVHYVQYDDELIPAGETEFAQDKTFGYENSALPSWIEEKTGGEYRAEDVVCITMEELRSLDYEGIERKLISVTNFGKVIVNSISYDDVKVFVTAFFRAAQKGKRFIFRGAAALVKVISGVADKPLLEKAELKDENNKNGGLILVGSHVQKTTAQLEALRERDDIVFIELNQHLVLNKEKFDRETDRVIAFADEQIAKGKTVAVYTRRERFDLNTGDRGDELHCASLISDNVTSIAAKIKSRPSFIVAKGGITSSDIGTKGLGVKKALVAGQILPGVPVWITGGESRFSALPYVIFPGNVGDERALLAAVEKFL